MSVVSCQAEPYLFVWRAANNMYLRNPIVAFLVGMVICAAIIGLLSLFHTPVDLSKHPLQDSIRAYKDSSAFYRGQAVVIRAEKDSLLRLLAENEPRVTYLTKNYYSPVPEKFAVSDSDAAALYILNFAEENR